MSTDGSGAQHGARRESTGRLRGDSGESAVVILIALTSLILVVGLVFEAGQLLAVQREARRVAHESSRAGAAEVSLASLYRGDAPKLDRAEAEQAATAWARVRGFTATVDFPSEDHLDGRVIEVTITHEHRFAWSSLGSGADIEVSARSLAADGASAGGR